MNPPSLVTRLAVPVLILTLSGCDEDTVSISRAERSDDLATFQVTNASGRDVESANFLLTWTLDGETAADTVRKRS